MLLGARTGAWANGNSEEEMYKELYNGLVARTISGDVVYDGTVIGDAAYQDCQGITSFTGANVTNVGNNAFYNCQNMTSISLPNVLSFRGSSIISFQTFCACANVSLFSFPKCTESGRDTFRSCYISGGGAAENEFYLPKCSTVGSAMFNGCQRARKITLHSISSWVTGGGNTCFSNVGKSLTADADGIKTTVEFKGCTMAELRAVTTYAFPFAAPTTTKFVCTDGYIVYENSTWTDYPNQTA